MKPSRTVKAFAALGVAIYSVVFVCALPKLMDWIWFRMVETGW